MAEEKNVASAAKPEQVDCLELVKNWPIPTAV